MKKLLVLLLVSGMLLFSGCAFLRGSAIKLSEEDMRNAEAVREIAKNLMSTWLLNSGFIRGALGSRFDTLPFEAVKAITELDAFARSDQELNDYGLGYSLGLRVLLLSETVKLALKQFAPEVLKLLPAALP